jgi:hypothetical protein
MRTRLSSAVLLSTLIAVVGCTPSAAPKGAAPVAQPTTSTAAPEPPPSPLEVVESGFVIGEGGTYYVDYGFVLKNPNTHAGALSPTVRVTLRDAKGVVLGTEDVVLKRIMPGASVAGGGEDLDPHMKKPKTVDFEVLDPGADWRTSAQMEPAGFTPLVVSGLAASTSGLMTSFTGELTNPNGSAISEVTVSVVMRDQAGRIIYVMSGLVGPQPADGMVPAGATVPFRMDMADAPADVTLEAYTQP